MIEVLGSHTKAAQAFGISQSVVSRAARDPEIAKLALLKKPQMADKFQQAVEKAIDSIISDAPNAKLKDSIAVCALTDKMLLLRGEPTQITENVSNPAAKEQATVILAQIQIELGLSGAEAEAKLIEIAPETARQAGFLR